MHQIEEENPQARGEGMEGFEEGVEGSSSEPAHHARRPMNAFLIFCKRHRSVVREKYPTLENRCITKILGEWWAQLEPPEKACYTELAKKYKEAFLEANPDFKWYKLPAPPLRTLITRPSNQKPPKLEFPSMSGPIVPGKLADETQLGGLSSLLSSLPMAQSAPKPPKKRYLEVEATATPLAAWEGTSADGGPEEAEPEESEAVATASSSHGALSEAWSQLGRPGPSSPAKAENATAPAAPASWATAAPETNNNEASYTNVHARDEDDKTSDTEMKGASAWFHFGGEGAEEAAYIDHRLLPKSKGSQNRRKSVRACKGKRYQEFMSSGRIATGKRGRLRMYNSAADSDSTKKRHNSGSSSASEKTDSLFSEASRGSRELIDEAFCGEKRTPTQTSDVDVDLELVLKKQRHISECSEDSEMDAHLRKRFRAADFNLDEKIDALPSLSLEEFQQKKKAKKKRTCNAPSTPKKHNTRDRSLELTPTKASKMIDGSRCMTPTKNPPLVGSQKRKARRLQITRVEPNATTPRDTSVVEPTLMSTIGLATLAEVAAVTKRLIKQ